MKTFFRLAMRTGMFAAIIFFFTGCTGPSEEAADKFTVTEDACLYLYAKDVVYSNDRMQFAQSIGKQSNGRPLHRRGEENVVVLKKGVLVEDLGKKEIPTVVERDGETVQVTAYAQRVRVLSGDSESTLGWMAKNYLKEKE